MVQGKTASKIVFLQNIFLRARGYHVVAPVGRGRLALCRVLNFENDLIGFSFND
jgi:hypothetical protein